MGKKFLLFTLLLGCMQPAFAVLPRLMRIYNTTGETLRFPNINAKAILNAGKKPKEIIKGLLTGDREATSGATIYEMEKAAKIIEIPNGKKKNIWLAPGNDLHAHRLLFRKKTTNETPLICATVHVWELTIQIKKSGDYYKIRRYPAGRRVPWRKATPCLGQDELLRKLKK